MMPKKSIYVFKKAGQAKIKIGMSAKPENRIKTLQGNVAINYSLFYTTPVNMPGKLESRIHNMLSKHSAKNEWFYYPFMKAVWIVRNLRRDYEDIPHKKFKETLLSKELRLLGMTRGEVAEKLKISTVTLSNWIREVYPITPVGVRQLIEIGVTKKAIKNPSKEV